MPYEWFSPSGTKATGGSETRLHLWPYRSLPKRGFVLFIGITAGLIALPLLMLLGSAVLWGLLPFAVLAVAGVWWGLQRSYRDGEIVEDLRLTPDQISLTRHGPHGRRQDWQANPYWVKVTVHKTGGPVPHYLTLKGNGREVELGAFLTEDERLTLANELNAALAGCPPRLDSGH